jgi:hypothetical protein
LSENVIQRAVTWRKTCFPRFGISISEIVLKLGFFYITPTMLTGVKDLWWSWPAERTCKDLTWVPKQMTALVCCIFTNIWVILNKWEKKMKEWRKIKTRQNVGREEMSEGVEG